MKNNALVILGLILSSINLDAIMFKSPTSDQLPIEEHTFLVYRRFYFVARLDKTIKVLAKIYQEVSLMQGAPLGKKISFEDIVPQETYRLFTHKQIRRSVKEIVHTKSLKPLFMVWDSFASYKSLHDDLLVEDFSKEIFIITKNTIKTLHKYEEYDFVDRKSYASCEELLDAISDMTSVLQNVYDIKGNILNRVENISDIKLAVHTDEVAFRFYCIRRLRKATDYLLSQKNRIQHEGVYKEFARLWDDITQYKYIDDGQYMHKAAARTLLLLQNNLLPKIVQRTFTQEDLMMMQHAIEQIPLEEILETIDLLAKQINSAMHHYQKSGLTFKQWLRKYWWAPTSICITAVIKCYLLYKNHVKIESSSSS